MSTEKLSGINSYYGWRPDRPDIRDHRFEVAKPGKYPQSVDLRVGVGFPEPYDQGDLGSCTANAIAGAIEYDQRRQKLTEFMPSRLFIYYNERAMEGSIASDSGAEIRDGIKSVNQLGVAPESDWKYNVKKFKTKPTAAVFKEALLHQSVAYKRVPQTKNGICGCLAEGYPIVFGFNCYESFEADAIARTGILEMPQPHEKSVGGHAVLCVGYDLAKGYVLVRNSWGADWGQKGYFWMPLDYILETNLADDFWQISKIE